MRTKTTMKVATAATSLLSLLAVAIAVDEDYGLLNFREARGMGGGLVKFMMVSRG